MTTKELKKYLEDFRDERQSVKHWIESLQYHYDHIKPYKDCYAVRKEMSIIQARIKMEAEQMEKKSAVILSWSELISNETYRSIFLDRYMNNITWEALEYKYHYCKSQIYNISRSVCSEIVSKTLLDIVPDGESLSVDL
ncbi:MAG: hypothetical protein IKE93_04350 [Erysipelotrichaceae bacterium]|nr:hypothetical protein [Erysipelotrichaceae bacterium]